MSLKGDKKTFRVLHTEPAMEWGGQEIRVLNEVIGMQDRGHHMTLVVQPGSQLERKAKEKGVAVETVVMSRKRWVPLIRDFRHIILRHQPQFINTHGFIDSWTSSIAGRLSNPSPLIIRTRHKSTPVAKTIRNRWLYGTLLHAVITTGDLIRQDLIYRNGLAASDVVSIPTGVDLGIFYPMQANGEIRRELKTQDDDFVVGTIAFLRDYKGVDYFVEAAQLLLSKIPNIKFWIIGSGPEQNQIMNKIENLGLTDRFVMTGFKEEVPKFLAHMDVFVLSSVAAEGIPQALTQAMAMERAVVATKVGGIPEVVQHGSTGLLTNPMDSQGLAENVYALLKDKEYRQRLGRGARQIVECSYSSENMFKQIEALYGRFGSHGLRGVSVNGSDQA